MNVLREFIRTIVRQELLTEGGNVFPEVNSSVLSKYLNSTIETALKTANLQNIKYSIIGNFKKPILGDIDIAVEYDELTKIISFTGDRLNFWNALDEFLSNSNVDGYKINKGLQQVHLLSPLVNSNGKHLIGVDSSGNEIGEKGFVQIDIMIGNLGFMKKSLSSSSKDSKYKAVYRNLLLADIFANVIMDTENPEVKKKFQMNWKNGVELVHFTIDEKGKRKKISVENMFSDMDRLAKFLFGDKYNFEDIDSFEKLYKLMKTNDFVFRKYNNKIFDSLKETLMRFKLELPKQL